jgi:hypothetical protein
MTEDQEVVPETVVFTCGCVLSAAIEDGLRILTISPCRPDCPLLLTTVGMAEDDDVPVYRVGADPITCEECGNDLAVEGHRYCLDCLEVLDP